VHYVQGVLLDITDRRRAEQERDQMELELQVASKLEAVGQLAAGVAHEINTPIQFVGDSVRFLHESVDDLLGLVDVYRAELTTAGEAVDSARVATPRRPRTSSTSSSGCRWRSSAPTRASAAPARSSRR
jgi:signal transduction histidine kinase